MNLSIHRHSPCVLTSPQLQADVLLHIVEPARHLYAAAVHTTVTFVGVEDGQGDIPSPDIPQKLVFWRLPRDHPCPIGVEKLVIAFGVGTLAFAPAHDVAVRRPG